jgi:hypothetical protein
MIGEVNAVLGWLRRPQAWHDKNSRHPVGSDRREKMVLKTRGMSWPVSTKRSPEERQNYGHLLKLSGLKSNSLRPLPKWKRNRPLKSKIRYFELISVGVGRRAPRRIDSSPRQATAHFAFRA